MLTLLNIPKQCICNKPIPLNSLFKNSNNTKIVKSALWYASIKPQLLNVKPFKTETIRYEEIQVIYLEITQIKGIHGIVKEIFYNIKYPCLLVLQYNDKYILSVCQFNAGKKDYNNNILKRVIFSHWFHPDCLSVAASKTIEKINRNICLESNLYEIYTNIVHEIENFSILTNGITKDFINTILTDLISNCSKEIKEIIFKDCTLHKKTFLDECFSSTFKEHIHYYDSEDVWYCLKKYDATNKVLIGRKYRDIEDLVYSIESKWGKYNEWV